MILITDFRDGGDYMDDLWQRIGVNSRGFHFTQRRKRDTGKGAKGIYDATVQRCNVYSVLLRVICGNRLISDLIDQLNNPILPLDKIKFLVFKIIKTHCLPVYFRLDIVINKNIVPAIGKVG